MKVLIVSKAFVNQLYRQKLTEMTALGINVVAATPPVWKEAGAEQHLEEAPGEPFTLHVLPMRFNGHFHLHYYPDLPALIRQVRPDLVHLDEEAYNFATFHGALAARRFGVPVVFFTWQNLLRRYPPPFSTMERAVYRWSSHAIAGNEESAEVLRDKGYTRGITVVPQFGVDPEVFSPGEHHSGPFTVGFFNRLIPGKAPILSLRAFARLPVDSTMLIVGDGPMRGEVEAEIECLGLAGRVHIKQRVESTRVPSLMRDLDALILPSISTPSWKEQFGRVLIEAMACGVPVVGSDSGEIPHVIGDAGLVVPEGDEEALHAAMERVYGDAALREDLGRRGRVRVLDRFTHRQVALRTLGAYRLAIQA